MNNMLLDSFSISNFTATIYNAFNSSSLLLFMVIIIIALIYTKYTKNDRNDYVRKCDFCGVDLIIDQRIPMFMCSITVCRNKKCKKAYLRLMRGANIQKRK